MGYQEYRDNQDFLRDPYFLNEDRKVFGRGFGHKLTTITSSDNSQVEQDIFKEIQEIGVKTGLQTHTSTQTTSNKVKDLVTQIVDLINTNEILLPLSNQTSFYSTVVLANALVNHIAVKAPEKTLTMIHSSYNQLIDLQNSGAHLLTNTGNIFAGEQVSENLHYIWNYGMMNPTTQLKSNTEIRNSFYSQAISKLRRDVTFQTQVQNLPITIANITTFDQYTQFRKHIKCISIATAISFNQLNPEEQIHIIANSGQFQEFIERFMYIHNIDPKSQAVFYDQDGRTKYNELV